MRRRCELVDGEGEGHGQRRRNPGHVDGLPDANPHQRADGLPAHKLRVCVWGGGGGGEERGGG